MYVGITSSCYGNCHLEELNHCSTPINNMCGISQAGNRLACLDLPCQTSWSDWQAASVPAWTIGAWVGHRFDLFWGIAVYPAEFQAQITLHLSLFRVLA